MLLSFLNATLTIQFSYVEMLKGKEKVGHTKQFKWLPPIHTTMLRILVEEVAKGNKPSNTFKASSFALVAKEISAQFGVECHPSYVKNRLRTLRKKYFQHYIVISSITLLFPVLACFVLLCISISVVVCVFDLLFIFQA